MNVIIEKNVQVRMRDGVLLATDVYRPDTEGRHPTLISRLPYNKEISAFLNFSFDVLRGAQAGYAVVAQDTRGRYGSEGDFNPFFDEARDGADTIAWAAAQPWSTGEVVMVGGSYFGATQWTAATEAPEALRAIAPPSSPPTSATRVGPIRGAPFNSASTSIGRCRRSPWARSSAGSAPATPRRWNLLRWWPQSTTTTRCTSISRCATSPS